jgi:hypothetical protein
MNDSLPPLPPFAGYYPLTIGQILDRIFRLLRGHIGLFLRIACVPAAGFFLIYACIGVALLAAGVFSNGVAHPDPIRILWAVFPAAMVAGLGYSLLYAVFEAAGTYAALQANQEVKASFREAYGVALENAGRFVWMMILRILWIGLPSLLTYALFGGLAVWLFPRGGNPSPGLLFLLVPLFFLAYLGSMAYAIIMGLRLALALPACVTENLTAVAALKRSLALTRNAKGRIFLVLLVVYAAGYVAFLLLEAVLFAVVGVGALAASAAHVRFDTGWVVAGIAVVALILLAALFLFTAALAASYAIAFAVLYHDQRLRVDGVPPVSPAVERA